MDRLSVAWVSLSDLYINIRVTHILMQYKSLAGIQS